MKFFINFLVFLFSINCFGQLTINTFEEIENLKLKKPIVVFLHTDWCNYCNLMQQTTFKDKEVVKNLNTNYYFISFNAESKKEVNFLGQIYKFVPTGLKTGKHQIAEVLGNVNGKINYPTTVILNTNYQIEAQFPYMLSSNDLIKILEYYD